jgi:hypothetical protein
MVDFFADKMPWYKELVPCPGDLGSIKQMVSGVNKEFAATSGMG